MAEDHKYEEQLLVSKIKKGDKSAFDKIFLAYYAYLCNYAFQFMKDKEASEEIVQDVFFQIWERHKDIKIHVSMKSYLFRSVHNHCLNHIEKQKTQEKYKKHNRLQISMREQEFSDPASDNELAVLIQKTIEELPPARKKIFQLKRDEGLKNKEIAEELNISIKTVENQMGKALHYLRNQLSDFLPVLLLGMVLIKWILHIR